MVTKYCIVKICTAISAIYLLGCTPSQDSGGVSGELETSASTQVSSVASETDNNEEESLADAFNRKDPPLPPPSPLLTNVSGRNVTSLNGRWNIVVDEHQLGTRPFLGGPYYKRPSRETGMELVEFSFDERKALDVPGDWNSQDDQLFRYRSVVWYERSLTLDKQDGERYFLHFDGANYDINVYVNGQPLGHHAGGYTAFNFDATDLLEDGDNFIVARIDAELNDATIPTLKSSDFFKYGGITRDVSLVSLPETYISQYQLYLHDHETGLVKGWAQLGSSAQGQSISLSLSETDIKLTAVTDANGRAEFEFTASLNLWSPDSPTLYNVTLASGADRLSEKIGFRTIERDGTRLLLNGEPVFLRGISMHDESFLKPGVAYDEADARAQLGLIKELNGNFVRLAHYPHNEYAVKMADELGLMVWSEIPIVSLIDWENPETLAIAKSQITDNVMRDRNRASIVMWSIANESFPQSEARLAFLKELASLAREHDESKRLIAAALIGDVRKEFEEVAKHLMASMLTDPDLPDAVAAGYKQFFEASGTDPESLKDGVIQVVLKDELGDIVDVIGYNEYFGWYYSSFLKGKLRAPESLVRRHMFKIMDRIEFTNVFGKPIIISEFGAGAKQGNRSADALLWSEEYQAKVYEAQISMLSDNDMIQGMSPWILKDFKSAMRNLNGIQDIYNRKGIVSEKGEKKLAFRVLQDHYAQRALDEERDKQ